jgi:predicted pyridoxine 5'-phosphate oxidase superfamily flavin-nucleotide-binding protein
LRVNGTARIVRDQWVREPMAIAGRVPDFAIVVSVEEVFLHCAKCVIRSKLWDSAAWPQLDGLASLARAIVDQGKLAESVEELHALIEKDKRERLY